MSRTPPRVGDLLYVVGWGATKERGGLSYHHLLGVWIMAYDNDFCQTLFRGTHQIIYPSMLCAGKECKSLKK